MSAIDLLKSIRSQTGLPIKDINKAIAEVGENAGEEAIITHLRKQGVLKSQARQDKDTNQGRVFSYVHEGRIGILLELKSETDFVSRSDDFINLGNDIALHLAAYQPTFVSSDEVSEDFINKELDIARAQLKNEGKPDDKIEMILTGKKKKIVEEVSLLSQSFLKDTSITITDLINQIVQKTGEKIVVSRFTIFNISE
jgi:elongation factor Ts